jgi:hypothetical protein
MLNNMKLILITILCFVIFQNIGKACTCAPLTEELIKKLKEDVDFVFIGKAISAKHHEKEIEDWLNEQQGGTDVVFKVDSVLKGNITKDLEVFIFQNGSSCDNYFIFGDSYLIFGWNIKKIKLINNSDKAINDFNYKTSKYTTDHKLYYKYLKKIKNQYIVINTDMCISFGENTKRYRQIISYY